MQFKKPFHRFATLLLALLGLHATPLLAVTLAPLNAGEELTCQFVNQSAYPDNQVYILVTTRDAANQSCYLNAAGALVPVVAGQNCSAYSMTLNTFNALQFPPTMVSGRLWISYGAPMNMPVFAGGGFAQPNLGNPTDPNINTRFDWMEFTVGGGRIFCNTTQVDLFSIPYTMALYDDAGAGYALNSTRGIAQCYDDVLSQYHAFMAAHAGAAPFDGLAGPLRIVAPNHGSFGSGQPNAAYFDAYINAIWAGPYRPAGVAKPSTQDVFGATGPLATQAAIDAALNRHVIDDPGNLNNPAAFYQSAPANFYGAFWHQVNLAGKAYGFAYDDANDQSSLQVSDHPRGLVLTLSGCAATPTPSLTRTPTRTSTRTSTRSPTPSRSPTRTATRTWTPTYSQSPTRTTSPTPTASATVTRTASPSQTRSASPSSTRTATRTASPTASDTPTLSASPSATVTRTATPTATGTVTGTLSPSATPTGSPSATPTATRSSTPSQSPTLSPSVILTGTPSASPTCSASPSGSPTLTVSPSSTPTPSGSPSATLGASPTLSATAILPPSVTGTSTPIPLLYQLDLAVYNAAGESVRLLYRGAAAVGPGGLRLDRDSLALGGAPLQVGIPGRLADGSDRVLWSGDNDGGQSLRTGIYSVKLQWVDPFGSVSAQILAVSVLDARPTQALQVFNAAGERVRQIDLPGGLGVGGFDLASDLLLVGGDSGASPGLKIDLRLEQGQSYPSRWDGRNDAGAWVDSGVYSIVLLSRQGSEGPRVMTKSVQVLRAPEAEATAGIRLLQNPLRPGQTELRIAYAPGNGLWARAQLFNLAGERVGTAEDLGQRGLLSLDCGRLSSGVYLARVELGDGTRVLGRKLLKVGIVR